MIKPIQENHSNHPSFKGGFDAVTQALTFLGTNQAIGASCVDFFSMSLPRTIIDSQRGVDAGIETGIRENSTTANTVMMGVVGAGIAGLLSTSFNKNYKFSANHIFANGEIIDFLGTNWHSIVHDESKSRFTVDQKLRAYYSNVLDSLVGLDSSVEGKNVWVGIKGEAREKIIDTLCKLSSDPSIKDKIPKDKKAYLKNLIISSTGAEKAFRMGGVSLSINSFLDNTFSLGKAFSSDRITNLFSKSLLYSNNKFIKELKSLKLRSSLLALAISGTLGLVIQPLNRYFTKKRTGHDGFVGVKSKKADTSPGFLATKIAAAATMFSIAMTSIAGLNWKSIPAKVQFRGKIPIIEQYKLLYGITIVSRFLASRDKNELRESFTRDILGFASWLILGGIAEKAVATAFDKKSLLNVDPSKGKGGFMTWLNRTSVKTRDEILQSELVKHGIKTVTDDGKALSLKDMLKKLEGLGEAGLATKVKVRQLNIAQFAGYLYSGLLLGVFIPKFNIYMTNKLNKDKAHAQENKVDEVDMKKSEKPVVAEPQKVSAENAEHNLLKLLQQ